MIRSPGWNYGWMWEARSQYNYTVLTLITLYIYIGNMLALWLIEKPFVGRKRLLIATMTASAISAFFFASTQSSVAGIYTIYIYLALFSTTIIFNLLFGMIFRMVYMILLWYIGTIIVACLFSVFSTAGWGALDCLTTESYPTSLRATAMGVLSSAVRFSHAIYLSLSLSLSLFSST